MHVIKVRNVNHALSDGLWWLKVSGVRTDSRNGAVVRSPEPVCTVYERPQERVLFAAQRDANPFFHYLESMWMLAGRNDVAFPATYAKQLLEYTDDGKTFNGAYGYRWREHFQYDQLRVIIDELRKNPATRRCVLAMWDGSLTYDGKEDKSDLHKAVTGSKDVPCNTAAYFDAQDGELNLTVCNRSNDAIWGAYGANAVHFSILLEYVAAGAGLRVGKYYQISNNFHVYIGRKDVDRLYDGTNVNLHAPEDTDAYLRGVATAPLFTDTDRFDEQLTWFFNQWDTGDFNVDGNIVHALAGGRYTEPALLDVALPMVYAHRLYKEGELARARFIVEQYVKPADWKLACVEWLDRRVAARAGAV